MSFWKKLFGGGTEAASGGGALGEEEYKGFLIKAVEMRTGSEYQLAGTIEKDGQRYSFVRADRFSNTQDLVALTLSKGRQIIDEQGASIFRNSPQPTRH